MGVMNRALAGGVLATAASLVALPALASAVDEAATAIADGQPESAVGPLATWIAQHPDDDRAKFLRATALAETGDRDGAIATLETLSQRHAERADVWNNLGILYARAGRLGKARDALVRAAGLSPNDAAIQRNLGDIYLASARAAYQAAGQTATTRDRQLTVLLPALASIGASSSSASSSNTATGQTHSSANDADVPTVSAPGGGQSSNAMSTPNGDSSSNTAPSRVDAAQGNGPTTAGANPASATSSGSSTNAPTASDHDAVAAVLTARAAARNEGNLSGWLAAYSDGFEPQNETRAQWVEKQHALLAKPLATPIHIDNVQVSPSGSDRLAASWDQITGSDGPRLTEHAQMIRQDGGWQILSLR